MHISMAFIFIYWKGTSVITLLCHKAVILVSDGAGFDSQQGKVLFLVYSVLTGCTAYRASQMENKGSFPLGNVVGM